MSQFNGATLEVQVRPDYKFAGKTGCHCFAVIEAIHMPRLQTELVLNLSGRHVMVSAAFFVSKV